MYKVNIDGREYNVEYDSHHQQVNGKSIAPDAVEFREGRFHILSGTQSFTAEVMETDFASKTFTLRINNSVITLQVRDKYDDLLREMGIDITAGKKVNDLKAPMPGLVLNVMVQDGQQVAKGDAVLVLEAMKMENIIKAPADGLIKKVTVAKGDKVEKNQVMIMLG
jgi:biotin carboxyl carrier protein